MDLNLYGRVLWRFRLLVASGVLLALTLGLLSFVKISVDGGPRLQYRQQEQWTSTGTIFITQEGFALGRAVYDEFLPLRSGGPSGEQVIPRLSDPSRFGGYASLYARLATSDQLRRLMSGKKALSGQVTAAPARDEANPAVGLPLLEIGGIAPTPTAARTLAQSAMQTLIKYVKRQQEANEIPRDRRVMLQVLNAPRQPVKVTSRSLTRPVFISLAVMMAVLALVFVLENLRPRVRSVRTEALPPAHQQEPARRTA